MNALTRIFASLAVLAAPLGAQQLPPVHPLGPVVAVSKTALGAVSAARQLPGGRVLVNDIAGRKVVLFDSTLAGFVVIADTTSATANAYSSRAGGLIGWKGDSTLFVDPNSLSMLVIDPAGKVTRVMSAPRANDVGSLIGGPSGTPAIDARGRLVYRAQPQFRMPAPQPGGGMVMPPMPDSAPVVRFDLAERKLDTVAMVRIPKQNVSMTQDDKGRMQVMVTLNPMPVADDWALLSDGSVAVLRGQDYHVDWVRADGLKASTPKVPFDWKRLSDDDKTAFLDSARTAMEKLRANAFAQQGGGAATAGAAAGAARGGPGGDGPQITMRMEGGPPPAGGGRPAPGGSTTATFTLPPINMVPISELPDYAPAFAPGAARGDLDGNLCVRTSKVVNGGSQYDVVNAKGELTDRVLMPAGRVIAGFGKGGVVYMGVRDSTGVRLEMARVR